jgi:hypothetical protein
MMMSRTETQFKLETHTDSLILIQNPNKETVGELKNVRGNHIAALQSEEFQVRSPVELKANDSRFIIQSFCFNW